MMLLVALFSTRTVIKVMYHQFDDINFIEKNNGEENNYKNYLVKRTIMSMLLFFIILTIENKP